MLNNRAIASDVFNVTLGSSNLIDPILNDLTHAPIVPQDETTSVFETSQLSQLDEIVRSETLNPSVLAERCELSRNEGNS